MKAINSKIIKFLFLAFSLSFALVRTTDADLLVRKFIEDNFFRGTTLDFANKQTANEFASSSLFTISSMIPTGFAVESIRIKKEGELATEFNISTQITSSESDFCNFLNLKILENWEIKFDGSLTSLSYQSDIPDKGYKDFVFVLTYPEGGTFLNKSCQFNFIFDSINNIGGFSDQEILENNVNTFR